MKVLVLKMLGRDERGRADEATVTIQLEGEDQSLYGYQVTGYKWEERPDDMKHWEDDSDDGSAEDQHG